MVGSRGVEVKIPETSPWPNSNFEDYVTHGTPPYVRIDPTVIIKGDVEIGLGSSVGWYSIIRGNVKIGRNLRMGSHSSIEGNVTIGDDVIIRGKCELPDSIIGNRVQIYSGVKFYDKPNPPDGPILPPIIEDDVVIACDSAILGGVTVGAGSFIGARVFLTESVPPNSYVTAPPTFKVRPKR
jgi:UDP-3-O-[3-hydroxymyristoyl] glucosamine N-acyltransferase